MVLHPPAGREGGRSKAAGAGADRIGAARAAYHAPLVVEALTEVVQPRPPELQAGLAQEGRQLALKQRVDVGVLRGKEWNQEAGCWFRVCHN